ncbi:MAG: hypothetical protein C5B51_22185 [Terriglobia bacterium]|nr:MAG: hypothetical protein C5B51_22185 [Terriglobia bacterium]
MSAKVFPPDHPLCASPITWRQVGAGALEAQYLPEMTAEGHFGGEAANQQIEQRLREAHAAGVREGETAGRNRAAAELQPVIDRLGHSIEEIANLRPRLRREAEADLLRLAMAIARRILRRELAVDPDAMHGLVLGALEKLQSQEICRVRVHPAHASVVTACLQKARTGAAIEVVPDASSQPGTVIFETGRGNLDASIESQLGEIERGLADRLRNPR